MAPKWNFIVFELFFTVAGAVCPAPPPPSPRPPATPLLPFNGAGRELNRSNGPESMLPVAVRESSPLHGGVCLVFV